MARPGISTSVDGRHTDASSATRERLTTAAIAALREVGFAGASARDITRRAGCNQGLVFYHFGSVGNLLLAALDEVSNQRLERYRGAVDGACDIARLVDAAQLIFREDLEAGYMKVLAEMIAGSSVTPGLGGEISTRISPWLEFTAQAIGRVLDRSGLPELVPTADLAYGVVALFLGLEMMAHMDGDPARATTMFDRVGQLAKLLGTVAMEAAGERDT